MKTLAAFILVLTSTNAFAQPSVNAIDADRFCEATRADARKAYELSLADIKTALNAGDISSKDAERYKKTASLLLVQADAACDAMKE